MTEPTHDRSPGDSRDDENRDPADMTLEESHERLRVLRERRRAIRGMDADPLVRARRSLERLRAIRL